MNSRLKKQIKALEMKINARKSKMDANYLQVKKTLTSPAVIVSAATLSGLALTGAILYKKRKKTATRSIWHRKPKKPAAVEARKVDLVAVLAGLVSILKLLTR